MEQAIEETPAGTAGGLVCALGGRDHAGRTISLRLVIAALVRVSTSEQNTRTQRRELKAVSERHGWQVVKVFEDAGISGQQALRPSARIRGGGRHL